MEPCMAILSFGILVGIPILCNHIVYSRRTQTLWRKLTASIPQMHADQDSTRRFWMDFIGALSQPRSKTHLDTFRAELGEGARAIADWIIQVLSISKQASRNMITEAIVRGGHYNAFIGLQYVAGLPTTSLTVGDKVDLLFQEGCGLSLWKRQGEAKVWVLRPDGLTYRPGRRERARVAFYLHGLDIDGPVSRNIEFRVPCEEKQGHYDDTSAIQTANNFHAWLDANIKQGNRDQALRSVGDVGERLVTDVLARLKPDPVFDFIQTKNMVYQGRNFEIDALVLAPNIGLLLLEAKYYSGNLFVSGDDSWIQRTSNGEEIRKNAARQAQRAQALLEELLRAHALSKWPIAALVVIGHSRARVSQLLGHPPPECEVVCLDDLERWLRKPGVSRRIEFEKSDVRHLREILKAYEQEYVPGAE